MKLLLSQKNILFSILEDKEFLPKDFSYEDVKKGPHFSVNIRYNSSSDFYFSIHDPYYESGYEYKVSYSPGELRVIHKSDIYTWFELTHVFSDWLTCLKRETSQIDLWDNLLENVKEITVITTQSEDRFTAEEIRVLESNMKVLQGRIATLALPQGQISLINEKLDSIMKQGRTLGKFDWQAQFVGALITLIVALSISQEMGKQIWDFAKEIFSKILFLPLL